MNNTSATIEVSGSNFRSVGDLLDLKNEELLTFEPRTKVSVALEKMFEKNYSQVPIKKDDKIIGVLSYRSITNYVHRLDNIKRFNEIEVMEMLDEDPDYVDHDSSIHKAIKSLDKKDYVLVGVKSNIRGIATVVDAMEYFYEVSSAFILIGEIELGIREIINRCIEKDTDFIKVILHFDDIILNGKKDELLLSDPINRNDLLNEFMFGNYTLIIFSRKYWDKYFQNTFGSKIAHELDFKEVNRIRNEVFHFKKIEVSSSDYNLLVRVRSKILRILEVIR
ncbi:MAG: CBS domain-containing protein [Candidatus Heimdallarchaeota archaeon]|nr:CBS domain-containing protein [Candidatus Heimdallarchaeota archaeon]